MDGSRKRRRRRGTAGDEPMLVLRQARMTNRRRCRFHFARQRVDSAVTLRGLRRAWVWQRCDATRTLAAP